MGIAKGICYGNDAFPRPYNPSTSNDTRVFFGSDNAANYCEALWGEEYTSASGTKYGHDKCRNDIKRVKTMGVETIRLYDWDPANDHRRFLDFCHLANVSVLASVSNYFLQPGGGLPYRDKLIPQLIKSFASGDDYHPSIVGIVFGNELAGYSIEDCAQFTKRWIEIEKQVLPRARKVRIGHPLSFTTEGGLPPCWHNWEGLLPKVKPVLGERLFLAPQTYNDASFLFGTNKWVDTTWAKFATPIWFTEIGQDRTKSDFMKTVIGQLEQCLEYATKHQERLLGACFFAYADKAWMEGSSEGSYGAYSHSTEELCTIKFIDGDFSNNHAPGKPPGELHVDRPKETKLHQAIIDCYK